MILLNSCSIIDDHAYPEKKKNFLLQHKNRNTQKIIQSFSTTFHIQSDLNLV